MKIGYLAFIGLLFAGGLGPAVGPAAAAATPAQSAKPAISAEASAALMQMGQTLRSEQFAFQAQTIREYADKSGQLLHIFHTLKVTVRRPNRLLVDRTGDDGSSKLAYDGKTVVVYAAEANKYATIPVPDTIAGMMKVAMGRLGVDFPLADFLTDDPNKAFLTGVTAGRVVNTVTIDGTACLHLLFSQPPGIELELWLEKNDRSLPRRLIVTYGSLPGQPSFIAEFSGWNFSIHPTDADFVFQPPAGAAKMELKAPAAGPQQPAKSKGGQP